MLERKKRRDVLESSGVQLVGEGVVVVNYRHRVVPSFLDIYNGSTECIPIADKPYTLNDKTMELDKFIAIKCPINLTMIRICQDHHTCYK